MAIESNLSMTVSLVDTCTTGLNTLYNKDEFALDKRLILCPDRIPCFNGSQ